MITPREEAQMTRGMMWFAVALGGSLGLVVFVLAVVCLGVF